MAGAIDVAEVPVGEHLLKRVASGRGPTAAATSAALLALLRRAPAQAQRRRALASLAPPAPICSADRATEQLPIGGGPHVLGLSQALRQPRPLRLDTARRRPLITARHAPGWPGPPDGASRGKAHAAIALRPPASLTAVSRVSCERERETGTP